MGLMRPKASQVNFDVTDISDSLVRLNSGQTGSNNKDVGLVIERGSDTNVALIWDESANQFAFINTTETGTTSGDVTIASYADLTLKRVTQSEQQYTTSNMMKFNQYYLGNAIDTYFDPNEYQKVLTITPAGDSENYQVSGRIMAQNAGDIHIVYFTAALRSGTLPDLSWSYSYTEEYNGSRYIDPQLWTKETTTAGFIVAFKVLARIYGTVTVDIDVIPRSSSLKSNVVMNTSASSEQATIDAGFTANDMTKVSTQSGTNITHVGSVTASAFVGDGSSLTGITSSYGDSDVATYLSSNGYGTSSSIIASITDSAPGTLDTLNELAAALGDDANFSTTVTNSIATKLNIAGGTITGTLTLSQDGQDVLNFSANDTNDRRGIAFNSRTALSADYNDGYLRLNDASEFGNGVFTPGVMRADGGFNIDGSVVFHDGYHPNADKWTTARTLSLSGDASGSVSWDGSADATLSTNITSINNDVTFDGGTNTTISIKCDDGGMAMVRANGDGQGTGAVEVGQSDTYGGGISYNGDGSPSFVSGESADHITFYRLSAGTRTEVFHYPHNSNTVNFNATPTVSGSTVWHAGNDGSGSGLDADTLDGMQPASTNTASTVVSRDASGNFSAGTITATATAAQYADLAEKYLADAEYPIGTVLEIGGDAEVTIANPDSYKIVGTVSEAPGLLMNNGLEGEHVVPVAYIGRVPCRVQGTIERGDFLVVGNTPGVAVAKHPRDILAGQAIGKALESHTGNEEGVIEILVGRL